MSGDDRQNSPSISRQNRPSATVEVKALNEVTSDEVVSKAREGIKWCQFATTADPDHKKWEYKLISDDNIQLGNTCRYILGTAHAVKEEA